MDVDQLISLVFENRSLWDMKDKNYQNRDIARRSWEKVAGELNTSSEAAKTKWRGLRDTFRKKWSKIPKKPSGDAEGVTSEPKWTYFKNLEFLKDTMHKRKLHGNVVSETTFDEGSSQNSRSAVLPDPVHPGANEPESETQTLEEHQNKTKETTPPQRLKAPHKQFAKMNNSTAVNKLVMLDEQKMQMLKESNCSYRYEDPDYHFLMSLLPFLKKIPEERKMIVRTKLQQVFCDENMLSGLGGQHQLQPIQHPPRNYGSSSCGLSTSAQHEDIASFLSSVSPTD